MVRQTLTITKEEAIAKIFKTNKGSHENSRIEMYEPYQKTIKELIALIEESQWLEFVEIIKNNPRRSKASDLFEIAHIDAGYVISANGKRMYLGKIALMKAGVNEFVIQVLLENMHYFDKLLK